MEFKINSFIFVGVNYCNMKKNQYNINGKEEGYWEKYNPNNKLRYKGNYINGKQEGYWEVYHTNGNLWYKGHFINGIKEGYWEEYDINGNLFCIHYYII